MNLIDTLAPNLLLMFKSLLIVHHNEHYELLARVFVLQFVNLRCRNMKGFSSQFKTSLSLFIDCSNVSESVKNMLSCLGLTFCASTCRDIRRHALLNHVPFFRQRNKVPLILLDNFNRLPKSSVHFLERQSHSCATMTCLVAQIELTNLETTKKSYNKRHQEFQFAQYDSTTIRFPEFNQSTEYFHLFDHFQLLTTYCQCWEKAGLIDD